MSVEAEEGGLGVHPSKLVVGALEGRPRSSGTRYRRLSRSLRPHWGCHRALSPFRFFAVAGMEDKYKHGRSVPTAI